MNQIHPTAIIEKDVILGENNYIGPFCLIKNGTVIGDNNRFEAYCSVGTPPEHKDHWEGGKGIIIGSNCVFREFITINSGCTRQTIIHDNVIMLRGSHHSHDSILEYGVTLSCSVLIGGYSHVMRGTNMGLGAICHQNSLIPPYCMFGMQSLITKRSNLEPFGIYIGSPVKLLKTNTIGIERASLTLQDLGELKNQWMKLKEKILKKD